MSEKEPKLETKDDAVNFVMEVFRSMGGTVLPPKRPRHIPRYTPLSLERDDFCIDFENAVLREWDTHKDIPRGPRRFENAEWAELIKRNVYPDHWDIDWEEYEDWVSRGHGDEWFQEEEDEDDEDNKWQTEERDSRICTMRWGDLACKLLDLQ